MKLDEIMRTMQRWTSWHPPAFTSLDGDTLWDWEATDEMIELDKVFAEEHCLKHIPEIDIDLNLSDLPPPPKRLRAIW